MDFVFIVKNIPKYLDAAWLTIYLAFFGIILSLIIGLLCNFIIYYKIRILETAVKFYIELSRNTPLIIQLFFLYYGFAQLGLKLGANFCAITGLAFLGGSYMAEAFRGGIEAIDKIQIESGLSIGLTKFQLIRYIILPQATMYSVPALGANAIFLFKETSVVSVIALADLVFVAKDLIGLNYYTSEALFMLVVSYLVLLLPISYIIYLIERKVRYAAFGN